MTPGVHSSASVGRRRWRGGVRLARPVARLRELGWLRAKQGYQWAEQAEPAYEAFFFPFSFSILFSFFFI